MNRVTLSQFKALKAKAAEKKAKRLARGLALGLRAPKDAPGARKRRQRLPSIKKLKKTLWDALTAYVRRRDGPICKICLTRPGYALYHLIPQSEGNAVRYDPENVVWGCHPCNYGEMHHRARYVKIHEEMFGKERMDRLWAKARTIVQYRRPDYERMIAALDSASPVNGSSEMPH